MMNTYIEELDLVELEDAPILAREKPMKGGICTVPVSEIISIKKGLEDFQNGNVRSHLQVKKRYEKWL